MTGTSWRPAKKGRAVSPGTTRRLLRHGGPLRSNTNRTIDTIAQNLDSIRSRAGILAPAQPSPNPGCILRKPETYVLRRDCHQLQLLGALLPLISPLPRAD